ncbi:2-oxo-4-hydroxy-4-carboxy-5-ureidoimidazoline decarboxylase [Microbacterium sp. ET2]|uniref:2-oxo-4-hydroxy-4-carboxy-5-ureidoimidazoline decarboxylase n=1 Tax=Microbacterium albipurpureum TaxID=3050384 RepID=UPI00259CF6D3|nr:2-oxo-4-hydroxy-4-carboxy-5-ureidoimidazoline decarboxylase [Microbacterium sp. ET2 (Ac-2212)]WJL94094.1 2-oxo-4-hydroxy-4-carboxy-5-ureidoimidazoline decarboxylase [Microbacterium sp. ET2 (Ac-2212)]
MRIGDFNALDEGAARDLVSLWAAIPRWVSAVVAGRPYPSRDELEATAATEAASWDADDLDQALAQHPRIGERPVGDDASATASRREQAAMTAAAPGVAQRIAAGNTRYEARFGRVFLIRARGRSAEEMLAELERRLSNTPESEVVEAAGQLCEIALGRLRETVSADRVRTG